jgi:transposase
MTTLVDKLVPDELWRLAEPLLPAPPRPWWGGRCRAIPDRNCFAAIVFMARTSTPWRLLPTKELGCGSPATAWRRLDEWAKAGVFEQLHLDVLDQLGEQGRLDWSRASIDSMSVRAKRGGDHVGANPVDRGKPGSKIQLACEGRGLPLTAVVTAANIPDVTMREGVVDDIPRSARHRAGGAPGPASSTLTRAITAPATAPTCGVVGSPRGLPGVGSSPRPGLGGTAGRSKGHCRG